MSVAGRTDVRQASMRTVAAGLLDELAALMTEPVDGLPEIVRLDASPQGGTAAALFLQAYDRFRASALAIVQILRAPSPGDIAHAAWDALIDRYEAVDVTFAQVHRRAQARAADAVDDPVRLALARSELLMNRASVTLSGLQTVLAYTTVRHAVVAMDRD